MFCKNCGNEIFQGDKNCRRCGTPTEEGQVIYNQPVEEPKPKKKSLLFKVLIVIAIIIVIIIALFIYTDKTSDKLVCKSSKGDITIMYKGEKLKGYKTKNASYDMDSAKELVERYGMEEYLKAFKQWFESESDGTCEYK